MNYCNWVCEIQYSYNHNKPTSPHLENDSKPWGCSKASACKWIPKTSRKKEQYEHLITCNSSYSLCTATGMHNGNRTGDVRIMYTEPHSCNHCCSGKAANITYYGCVFVTLGVHYATHMHLTVTCGLSDSTIFLHYLVNGMIFEKCYWPQNTCILILMKPEF